MNFLQTYRRHLIFKLAGIAAVILAVLSSAYLFMSADYARSVRKNTLALNERLTALSGILTYLHNQFTMSNTSPFADKMMIGTEER